MSQERIQRAQALAASLIANPYTHEQGLQLLDNLSPKVKEFDNGTIGTGNDFIGYRVTGRQAVPKITQAQIGIHGPFGSGTAEVPISAPGSNVSVPGVDQIQKMIDNAMQPHETPQGQEGGGLEKTKSLLDTFLGAGASNFLSGNELTEAAKDPVAYIKKHLHKSGPVQDRVLGPAQ